MFSSSRRRSAFHGTVAASALLLSGLGVGMAQAAPADGSAAPHRAGASSTRSGLKATADLPASACTVAGYTPTRITIGTNPKTATFTPQATGCTISYYAIFLYPFLNQKDDSDTTGIAWEANPAAALDPHRLTDADAGKLVDAVEVDVWGDGETPDDHEPSWSTFGLTLQKASIFTGVNASPEPVKKGKNVTVKGTLTRVRWNQAKHLKYVPYGKAAVQVQFRAAGAAAYTTVKTVNADSQGRVSTTVKASKTGNWRLYFAGISTTAPTTSSADNVVVTS